MNCNTTHLKNYSFTFTDASEAKYFCFLFGTAVTALTSLMFRPHRCVALEQFRWLRGEYLQVKWTEFFFNPFYQQFGPTGLQADNYVSSLECLKDILKYFLKIVPLLTSELLGNCQAIWKAHDFCVNIFLRVLWC